jgi:hypothetical protein
VINPKGLGRKADFRKSNVTGFKSVGLGGQKVLGLFREDEHRGDRSRNRFINTEQSKSIPSSESMGSSGRNPFIGLQTRG